MNQMSKIFRRNSLKHNKMLVTKGARQMARDIS